MKSLAQTFLTLIALCLTQVFQSASGDRPIDDIVPHALMIEALRAREHVSDQVLKSDYMTIIDYRLPSGTPRFYLINMSDQTAVSFLVAHGKGSDRDHDGRAEAFSNIQGSKMTSLGAFVTGETYYGQHGLSLRLRGLEARNNQAEKRLIVIHGASYVSPTRKKMGRSWGCPALEKDVALEVIPLIKEGSFVYAAGS